MTIPIFMPSNSAQVFPSLQPCQHLLLLVLFVCFCFLIVVILTGWVDGSLWLWCAFSWWLVREHILSWESTPIAWWWSPGKMCWEVFWDLLGTCYIWLQISALGTETMHDMVFPCHLDLSECYIKKKTHVLLKFWSLVHSESRRDEGITR